MRAALVLLLSLSMAAVILSSTTARVLQRPASTDTDLGQRCLEDAGRLPGHWVSVDKDDPKLRVHFIAESVCAANMLYFRGVMCAAVLRLGPSQLEYLLVAEAIVGYVFIGGYYEIRVLATTGPVPSLKLLSFHPIYA